MGHDPLVLFMRDEIARQRLRQTHVARKAGVNDTTMSNWIGQNRVPSLMDMRAVLNVLGYEIIAVPMAEAAQPVRITQADLVAALEDRQAAQMQLDRKMVAALNLPWELYDRPKLNKGGRPKKAST